MRLFTRRHTTLVAGVALALGAAACADSSGGSAGGPPKVAFLTATTQLNFATEMIEGFRAGAGAVDGVEHVVDGPQTVDGPRQLEILRDLVAKDPAGISVFTLSPELLAPSLSDAAEDGIPLIAVDNPPGPGTGVRLFVGNDNYELGRILAGEIIERLPPAAAGTVVLGTSAPGVSVLGFRAKGMRDEFRKRMPKVRVLGPADTKEDTQLNQAAWRSLVRRHPGALAFLGTGDQDGWNLADIRKRTKGRWLAGAFDLDPRSLKAVQDGHLLLVSPEHYVKGAVAGRLQAEQARGGGRLPEGWVYTPGLVVDRSNLGEIIKRQASPQAKHAWFRAQIDALVRDAGDKARPLRDAR